MNLEFGRSQAYLEKDVHQCYIVIIIILLLLLLLLVIMIIRFNWTNCYHHVHNTYALNIWTRTMDLLAEGICSSVHVLVSACLVPSELLSQWSTEVPLRRVALGVCPCGDPWGTPFQVNISYSWTPVKPTRGQTPRSPRPKVTSVLFRLSAPAYWVPSPPGTYAFKNFIV